MTYEIPLSLLVHNKVDGQLLKSQVQENFDCKGLTVFTESNRMSAKSATHDILKVDMIYNPEYSQLLTQYSLPVFIRSCEEPE